MAKNFASPKWIATPAAGKDWVDVESGSNLPVLFGGFHGLMIAGSILGAEALRVTLNGSNR